MPRIEIELTSSRPDGTWTWRASGARQPKGTLEGSLLYPQAAVGDVVRAECEVDLDGTRVTAVLPTRQKRSEPERIDITGSGREAPLVTQDGRVPSTDDRPRRSGDRRGGDRPDRGPRGERGDRRDRPDRGERAGRPGSAPGGGRAGDGRRPEGRTPAGRDGRPESARGDRRPPDGARPPGRPAKGGRPRAGGDRPAREEGERRRASTGRARPDEPGRGRPTGPPPARPRPKRLQPGRKHREAVLADLPPEQRPVAEQVLRGGIPSVRQAVDEQNARAREAGEPEVRADALVTLAEGLLPRLRAAEWRDRAEAAAADVDEIGLRDLRAVVAGSDAAGRDDECRALISILREALERRIGVEQEGWLGEIRQSLAAGRVVRALRVSGRPPEPGVRFPAELLDELSTAAGAAMTPETTGDRWVALLDAVVGSPVRRTVTPQGIPSERGEDLERALRLAAPRVPALQALLGGPRPPGPRRPQPTGPGGPPPAHRGDRRPPRPPRPAAPRAPTPAPDPSVVAPAPPAAAPSPPAAEVPAPPAETAEVPAPPAETADVPAPLAETAGPPAEAPAPPAGTAAPQAPPEPTAVEPQPVPPTEEAGASPSSGDDGDDAVLVEELR